ncbi:hypothetical protein BG011_001778 [Mortierella polycephala]|uniref:Uncharacterized protein n=1 Tax=Mortierella polycephala TaxID=41804 RepID=A0A9P6QGD9_9FUNG|nr:hypothetical protein BG011_001778 [Mortierella polycephala]
MDDDIDYDSDLEQQRYNQRSKRRAREIVDEVDDDVQMDDDNDVEESYEYTRERQQQQRRHDTKGGAGPSRVHEIDEQEEDEAPSFRPVRHKEAMHLSAEFLRLFTVEALHRMATYQREQEDEELKDEETVIELDTLEAITPQLVMDF